MTPDSDLPEAAQKYVSLKQLSQEGLTMPPIDQNLLEIIKNKNLEDLNAQDPDILEKLLEKLAKLSAVVYVLEREINGIRAPIHHHLGIDPLRHIDVSVTKEPAGAHELRLHAEDLNPKYGWHALERSGETMWRWAGASPRAAILLPPLVKGVYRVQAHIWPFHDFDISKDLEVSLFGRRYSFSHEATENSENIWCFEAEQDHEATARPEVLAFFIGKSASPKSIGTNQDKRELAFAFQSINLTKID